MVQTDRKFAYNKSTRNRSKSSPRIISLQLIFLAKSRQIGQFGVWDKIPGEGEFPLFLELPEFPYNTMRDKPKEASVPKTRFIILAVFERTPACNGQTPGHTYTALCRMCVAR